MMRPNGRIVIASALLIWAWRPLAENGEPNAECAAILAAHPNVQARASEKPEMFLGDLRDSIARNRDLAADWRRLKRIETMADGDKHLRMQAKRELTIFL